jgi:hypothetical protein
MDESGTPVAASKAQEITCPQCGRYVGPLARCPHCGARQPQRIGPRALRIAVLLLATAGLFLLWLLAIHRAPPLVKIADIQPTMNFALVRVAGKAAGEARTFREAGKLRSVRFTVNDGTGDLSVSAYGKQAEQLALFDRIPRAGDVLEVAGILSVDADKNVSLRLQSGDALKLQRAEKTLPALPDVKGVPEGGQVLVTGTVTRVIAPRPGSRAPYVVTVRDAAGEQQFVIWAGVFEQHAGRERLVTGAAIRAQVTAENYKGKLQLKLGRAADLELVMPAAAPATNAAPKAAGP